MKSITLSSPVWHRKHVTLTALAVVGLSFSNFALAQLEEVIVTATRMGATDLQDTALAVTAFTSEDLERMVATDVRDLQHLTPGLVITENTGMAQVYIRGIGTNNVFAGSDPSSTIHVDGIYIARPVAMFNNFLDVERVEVLRGPQGTLYGRNSVGGTINVISRKPSLEAVESKLQATLGDYDLARFEGYVSGPLSDSFALGIAAQWSKRDGYRENVTPSGEDMDDEDSTSIRAQALWKASDSVQLVLRADYSEEDIAAYGYHTFIEPPPLPVAASIFGDFGKVSANYPQSLDRESSGIGLDIDWDINDSWSLKSLTAYRENEFLIQNDSDASELDIIRVFIDEDQDQFSQEFHFIGNWSKATALIGLYYFEEDVLYTERTGINVVVAGISRRPQPELNTTTKAIFAEATFDLSDQWSVTVGGRYTDEKKDFTKKDGVFLLGSPDPDPDTPPGPQLVDLSFPEETGNYDEFTPSVGLQYHANEDVMVYGSIKKGFKSGGFNFTAILPGGYDSETMWSYEAGVKTTSKNQKARFNVAAFYYDVKDLQVQTFVVPGQVDTSNAATATVKGIEFETIGQITDDFNLALNLAYLDAEYGDYPEAPVSGGGTFDASGNRLNSSPEWSGALIANYQHSFGANAFYARGEYAFQAKTFFTADNNDVDRQGSYGLLGLSVGYLMNDGRYDISLWGRNLTDEEYITTSAGFSLVRAGRAGPPRSYGIRLTWNY